MSQCVGRVPRLEATGEPVRVSQCVGRVPRLEATGEPVRVRTSEAIKTHFFNAIRAFTLSEGRCLRRNEKRRSQS
ncbi:MAG: hypothetical protein HWQ38_14365 [Nostoc sp. NMS7]|uniref:hypothetical protein n=1 Tax=Nostoc sp. NMS7 TaxID=2815391 RepID=UPI0025E3422A|nr:hypothetical protein [Nostoc sp. NMS7]MBN3947575.1 hypothetical protein [Nostoc sp. NMS7]